MSMVLPAVNGTMARMVLSLGQTSALARCGSAGVASAAAVNVKKRRRLWLVTRSLPEFSAPFYFGAWCIRAA